MLISFVAAGVAFTGDLGQEWTENLLGQSVCLFERRIRNVVVSMNKWPSLNIYAVMTSIIPFRNKKILHT